MPDHRGRGPCPDHRDTVKTGPIIRMVIKRVKTHAKKESHVEHNLFIVKDTHATMQVLLSENIGESKDFAQREWN